MSFTDTEASTEKSSKKMTNILNLIEQKVIEEHKRASVTNPPPLLPLSKSTEPLKKRKLVPPVIPSSRAVLDEIVENAVNEFAKLQPEFSKTAKAAISIKGDVQHSGEKFAHRLETFTSKSPPPPSAVTPPPMQSPMAVHSPKASTATPSSISETDVSTVAAKSGMEPNYLQSLLQSMLFTLPLMKRPTNVHDIIETLVTAEVMGTRSESVSKQDGDSGKLGKVLDNVMKEKSLPEEGSLSLLREMEHTIDKYIKHDTKPSSGRQLKESEKKGVKRNIDEVETGDDSVQRDDLIAMASSYDVTPDVSAVQDVAKETDNTEEQDKDQHVEHTSETPLEVDDNAIEGESDKDLEAQENALKMDEDSEGELVIDETEVKEAEGNHVEEEDLAGDLQIDENPAEVSDEQSDGEDKSKTSESETEKLL